MAKKKELAERLKDMSIELYNLGFNIIDKNEELSDELNLLYNEIEITRKQLGQLAYLMVKYKLLMD